MIAFHFSLEDTILRSYLFLLFLLRNSYVTQTTYFLSKLFSNIVSETAISLLVLSHKKKKKKSLLTLPGYLGLMCIFFGS